MAQPYTPLIQQLLREFQDERYEAAERTAQYILRINPKDVVALQIFGLVMVKQGRIFESISPLSRAARLDDKNEEALSNLARAQYCAELYSDAIETYDKLNRLSPNNPQTILDLGTAHAKYGHYENAIDCYEKVIKIAPNYFLAWSNYGNLMAELGFYSKAIKSYETALELNPNHPESWTNYGNAFFGMGLYDRACLAHEKALSIDPNYGVGWANHGNALIELKRVGEALDSYQKAYSILPELPFLAGQLMDVYANNCDWKNREKLVAAVLNLISKAKPASAPFILLQTNASLELIKSAARMYVKKFFPYKYSSHLKLRAIEDRKKIRIGYFSSDFREHPVGILMENLICLHDRSQFEVYGFFLNKKVGDDTEKRLTNLFDNTFDLFGIDNFDAHQYVMDLALDIAIDLNGHTAGARTDLFARRLAPIQFCYLGFPGTSGADFYEYLIADNIVVPPEHKLFYTEQIAYLPNSFFPADTLVSREDFGDLPARSSQGLPDEGFIFSCFNNAYKITPDIFDIWMNLLNNVPKSILWLSKPSNVAIENLKREAATRGIDPSRLIFAIREPTRKRHLGRLRLADLFLDTIYFNAHTTAADALWAGVPVLTILGDTFSSRVASSMLAALGMNEMIVASKEGYYEKAYDLATHPNKIAKIRKDLDHNRSTKSLFNTKQYVKDLEALYLSAINKCS